MKHAATAKYVFRSSLFCASLLCVSSTAGRAEDLVLLGPGTTPTIVVGTEASASEKFAAQELAEYLGKITGHTLPVVDDNHIPPAGKIIAVGKSKLTSGIDISKLGIEQFITDVRPNRLSIIGGRKPPTPSGIVRDRGTLYGVYEFLDNLGVRWYRPENWGEYVPHKARIVLPVKRTVSKPPAYLMRSTLAGAYSRYRAIPAGMQARAELWSARNRLNWNELGNDFSVDKKYGGKSSYNFEHIYSTLMPKSEYFDKHPEYFALIKGKRNPDGQLCHGNIAVQNEFARRLIEKAKENPQWDSATVEANDGGMFCECALCKAMDDPGNDFGLSNRICSFNNIIARKVAAVLPDLKIHWLAYSFYTDVPATVKQLEPNTIIQLATIDQLYDEKFPWYGVYSRKLSDPENTPFREALTGWAAMKPSAIMTYEYWSGYGWIGPFPMVRTIADRLKNYRKYNVRGFYNEASPSWGPQGLELYMVAKLAWNPDLNVDRELDLYYRNFYGPAAKPMKIYHETLMKAVEKHIVFSGGRGMHLVFTPALIAKLDKPIAQAQALVKGQPLYEKRLLGVAAGHEYSRRVCEIIKLKANEGIVKPVDGSKGTYLYSPKAEVLFNDLKKYVASFNGDVAVFDIMKEDGDRKEPVSAQLIYMGYDLLTNGVYPHRAEAPFLTDFKSAPTP